MANPVGESNKIIKISKDQDFTAIIAKYPKVIVKFTGEGCEPCKLYQPIFEQLQQKYPEIIFVEIDLFEGEEICNKLSVRAIPDVRFFVAGLCANGWSVLGFEPERFLLNFQSFVNNY